MEKEDRFVIIYDKDDNNKGFSSDNFYEVEDVAVSEYEDGGHEVIEIVDNEFHSVVWTTDEDGKFK